MRFVCSSWSLLHKLRSQQANGGTVVQLEINADMVLVDHARKDCPVGSISWTWVEQSLKNGTLEDIEDHRAGPVHAPVREVGSTQPTKKTRTKFSPEDDKILLDIMTLETTFHYILEGLSGADPREYYRSRTLQLEL